MSAFCACRGPPGKSPEGTLRTQISKERSVRRLNDGKERWHVALKKKSVKLVTAYYPGPKIWEEDLRTLKRKKRQK